MEGDIAQFSNWTCPCTLGRQSEINPPHFFFFFSHKALYFCSLYIQPLKTPLIFLSSFVHKSSLSPSFDLSNWNPLSLSLSLSLSLIFFIFLTQKNLIFSFFSFFPKPFTSPFHTFCFFLPPTTLPFSKKFP